MYILSGPSTTRLPRENLAWGLDALAQSNEELVSIIIAHIKIIPISTIIIHNIESNKEK
jgi:hypothetical protein